MKRFLLTIVCGLASMAGFAQEKPQIVNGDFESWSTYGVNLPDSWNSFQTADGTWSAAGYSNTNRQVKQSNEVRPGSAGSHSCVIWARTVMGVVAQGNLTTGCVHAGSMQAANAANYNYTKTAVATQAMKFTGKPDSMVVWVKYVPAGNVTGYNTARVSAIIHDNYDYITYGLDSNDTEENKSHVVGKAAQNFESNGAQWQRLVIPFDYESYSNNNPQYIIVNASTNSYPGKGTENDSLYIDDIEMIYNEAPNPGEEKPATAYVDDLKVTVNGSLTEVPNTTVYVADNGDGTIDFRLTNLVMTSEDGDVLPVGNIKIEKLKLNEVEGEEYKTFAFNDSLKIAEGDDSYEYWIGPTLGEVPLVLNGKITDEKLYVTIDIDMQESIEQTIYVVFGSEFTSSIGDLVHLIEKAKVDGATQDDINGLINKILMKANQ